MSATDELYSALREIDVPAEKAQAVVNALEGAKNKTDVRDAIEQMPAFNSLGKPELEKLRDELLELMLQHALK
jgi:hypothetical protein